MNLNLASSIDHTLLRPNSTEEAVSVLCTEAVQHNFASVCVLPWFVPFVNERLAGSSVATCTVVSFPLGACHTSVKVAETVHAINEGATEIDMVATICAIRSNRWDAVRSDIRAVTETCHAHNAIVKVIIETCLLTHDEKLRMCEIVTECEADFIKTSTGFSTGGATIEDIELMRIAVGAGVQIKASGGIRDRATALAMMSAGATRIGTSNGVTLISGS